MGVAVTSSFSIPRSSSQVDVGATVRWADTAAIGVQFDGLRALDVWA